MLRVAYVNSEVFSNILSRTSPLTVGKTLKSIGAKSGLYGA